jgi:TPR repeat protein
MVIAFSSRIVYASTPNVNELQVKAQKGFVNQEIELAQAYFMGDGVAHDQKLAAYWYQKAAESGNPEAQNLVGYFYEMGLGVPVDAARAFHWYQLSVRCHSQSRSALCVGRRRKERCSGRRPLLRGGRS